ncbi:MAG: phosphoribosyl-AMP cyclohydrolase [Candidatus Odinarchaeum yellowstonii]|uniref:Phosphoribosyl-AMP cyclohydrolase n=1 Tax=Odinarchaeota yellowstonii (strain LCB_4) TaxID=1841599 RepID=A0AAF0D1D7_ODILC|nr:MAG: phosphoribosyl-AMP cyclohydrolase [Candidatus Odinarchaeum yellowstonii]
MILDEATANKIVESINFKKMNGLIPVVVQDITDNRVLMVAFADKEAVIKSLTKGFTHFYSRSRKKIWMKGDTSGHTQKIIEVYLDCDNDTILFKVEQNIAACHTGFRSCFYRKMNEKGEWFIAETRIFEPSKVYGKVEE